MSDTTMILLGCAGGLLPDILRLVKGRHDPNIGDYWKSWSFRLGLFFAVVLGGLAVYLIKPTQVVEALAIGFSAPEILSRIFAKEQPSRDRDGGEMNMRTWWAI